MNKINVLLLLSSVLVSFFSGTAQTVWFDINEKATSDSLKAYYVRTQQNEAFSWSYVNGGVYRTAQPIEANALDESLNRYVGIVTTYYSTGEKKMIAYYDENGLENGSVIKYYRSGKVEREKVYSHGVLSNNLYYEYDEFTNKTLVWKDSFNDNSNGWDLYTDDLSSAKIENGRFFLESKAHQGAARFLDAPEVGLNFLLETTVNVSKLRPKGRAGLVFGFKDWDNYQFFIISQDYFFIGIVREGVLKLEKNRIYSPEIMKGGDNKLSVFAEDEFIYFVLNGNIKHVRQQVFPKGRGIGCLVSHYSGIASFDDLVYKKFETYPQIKEQLHSNGNEIFQRGTGVVISSDGLILTTSSVIKGAEETQVVVTTDGVSRSYIVNLIAQDTLKNFALLKIDDPDFEGLQEVPYSFFDFDISEADLSIMAINNKKNVIDIDKSFSVTKGAVIPKKVSHYPDGFFKTNIPIELASNGGPLFSVQGALVGIVDLDCALDNRDTAGRDLKDIISFLESAPIHYSLPNGKNLTKMKPLDRQLILSEWIVPIKIAK